MITLSAKLKLSEDNGEIEQVEQNNSSNVSSVSPINVFKQSQNPFQLSVSKLGDGEEFKTELDYFLGSEISDENGNFENPYTIKVIGSDISTIQISFDKKNGTYPTNVKVDRENFQNDDYLLTISVEPKSEHTITISSLNAPNKPLVITGICADITIDIDRTNIKSLQFTRMERDNMELPSWGIFSNSGSIELVDKGGDILDLVYGNVLKPNQKVEIYLNNTLAKTSKLEATFKTTKWNYDNINRSIRVDFDDGFTKMQETGDISYTAFYGTTLLEYLENYLIPLTEKYGYKVNAIDTESDTAKVLGGVSIVQVSANKTNLWNKWADFAVAGRCCVYASKNGYLNVVYVEN